MAMSTLGKTVIGILSLSAATAMFITILHFLYNDRGSPPIRRVAFLKLHKVGSSTVQNIFIRYGDYHNLTFVLANERKNECEEQPNCISFNKTLMSAIILPPPPGKSFDILCSHVLYNRESFRRYFSTSDTRYVALLREPTTRLESAIAFFDVDERIKSNFSVFANNPTNFEHSMLNNRMAYEFGFDKKLFPAKGHTSLNNEERMNITSYLQEVVNDFDLLMILEKIDESLVLLKRLLRWSTKDMLFSKKLVREHDMFSSDDRAKVKNYLHLDYLLYDKALDILNGKIEEAGPEFLEEVEVFKLVNSKVSHFCSCAACADGTLIIEGTKWYETFSVDRKYCQKIILNEVPYLRKIRRRQYD